MPPSAITEADERVLPASYCDKPRYLGFGDGERNSPYAKFIRPDVRPIQPHVAEGLLTGRSPSERAYELDDAPNRMSASGYHAMETGFARSGRGTLVVSCLTDMPNVTSAMWDWWFGWHGTDTARYKLWHPAAHQYCAFAQDRSADRRLSDRQRYVDNVAFVDEYIGHTATRLAIRFVDPARLGFTERPGTIFVCGRVSSSEFPVSIGWVIHQVRETDGGSEMRSRFFLGHPEVLTGRRQGGPMPLTSRVLGNRVGSLAFTPALRLAVRRATDDTFGHAMLHHCAAEMNHLAGFLPELYTEFHGTP